MIRYLLLLLFFWMVYRFIRGLLVIRGAARSYTRSQEPPAEPEAATRQAAKLIPKEEGEYVDFEEIEPTPK